MRAAATLVTVLIVSAVLFFVGINWGLPSHASDAYLLGFDNHNGYLEPLTKQVSAVDEEHGADVVESTEASDKIVPLNDTDPKRARILCRYRLYSEQPDEMITFRALSLMNPRDLDFDPRMYQYGGLWIYPVGAMIEAAGRFGFFKLGDREFYIQHPNDFAWFYVVARAYSAMWGLLGVSLVFALLYRLSPGLLLPGAGTLCFALMPVVIDLAHEAKPHLAGAVLVLLTILAAAHYLDRPSFRRACFLGIACGAASGMVLWGAVAFLAIAMLLVFAPDQFRYRLLDAAIAAGIGISVYAISNPYVIIHLCRQDGALWSNLSNTAAMYGGGPDLLNAAKLVVAGTGLPISIAGLAGLVLSKPWQTRKTSLIIAVVALAAAIVFFAKAGGKTGEYGRFALAPDVGLLIAGVVMIGRIRGKATLRITAATLLLAGTALYGLPYLNGFIKDGPGKFTTRLVVAQKLQMMLENRLEYPVLGIFADPAPYNVPPVDLVNWKVVRLTRDMSIQEAKAQTTVIVRPRETVSWWDFQDTPISWADKPFDVIYGTFAGSKSSP
jgi:hypothetical protein